MIVIVVPLRSTDTVHIVAVDVAAATPSCFGEASNKVQATPSTSTHTVTITITDTITVIIAVYFNFIGAFVFERIYFM